jgi:hypothetical protein
MSRDVAELVLKGRITLQEALEISGSHRKLEEEIDKSCIKQGLAMQTFRREYKNRSLSRR